MRITITTTILTLLCTLTPPTASALADEGTVGGPFSTFSGSLNGSNQPVPVFPAGSGQFSATWDPTTMTLEVSGSYGGMTSDVTVSHVHSGAAGVNGGVVFALTNTGGTSGTFSGSDVLDVASQTALFNGGLYVNIHTNNNPGGEIRDQINFVATINGTAGDPNENYISIATKLNANLGFGPAIDVTEILYIPDDDGQKLYIAVKSKLNVASNDALGLWLNFDEVAGTPPGAPLGTLSAGSYMDGDGVGTGLGFAADFEVDYMFAFNPGLTNTTVWADAVRFPGGAGIPDALGSMDQFGNTSHNTGSVIFSTMSVLMAYNNAGAGTTGLELCIPYSELGVTSFGFMEAFAFIVSDTGFFSDVTVPGDVIANGTPDAALSKVANLGVDAPFHLLEGGPYHSGAFALPVELADFSATVDERRAILNWTTLGEINNAGFQIEHAESVESFRSIGFAEGYGTTDEPQAYSFAVDNLTPGRHLFRLRQIDLDGAYEYSEIVEAIVEIPDGFVLEPVYPNPFNPQAIVRFAVEEDVPISLNLYNAIGQHVQTLFEGTAGGSQINEVRIDGSTLTGGVYFVRLEGDGISDARSVTLVR